MNIIDPLTIIICLPGSNFSGRFLDCLINLLCFFNKEGIKYYISRRESNNIYYVRNLCLGGNVLNGENQKPFEGKIEYNHILWIDSDSIFTPDNVVKLLDRDVDIVAAYYAMSDMQNAAAVENLDDEYLLKHGNYEFLKISDLSERTDLISVALVGMGFMLVKKGVFEKLKYPWFNPRTIKLDNITDFCGDDASFCLSAKAADYEIFLDPTVRIGHYKSIVL